MFHIVEKYKTPAQIVLGIIGLTFIGFGANNLSSPGSDYIVKVGDGEGQRACFTDCDTK